MNHLTIDSNHQDVNK